MCNSRRVAFEMEWLPWLRSQLEKLKVAFDSYEG